jgi:8-amino-7-oxononanoate synthase
VGARPPGPNPTIPLAGVDGRRSTWNTVCFPSPALTPRHPPPIVRGVLPSLREEIAAELLSLDHIGRLRDCPPLDGGSRTTPLLTGRPVLSFSSNDYLGLAAHPALAEAAAASLQRTGFGAAAARLVSGEFPDHRALEQALAAYLGVPAALTFATGYQANIGVLTTLASRDDLILSDAHNHASIIDGCRLSRAKVLPYPHCDLGALADGLRATAGQHRRRLIVSESLFSMGGDLAPLADLAALAERHQAALIVDEAHALGVLGPEGRGLCQAAGVVPDALVGTLGKAFGSFGGFVAGSPELGRLLVNRARTFIFTTAPPPAVAAASTAGVELAASTEGSRRRAALMDRIRELQDALALDRPLTPIVPFICGSDQAAVAASRALREAGIFVQAIRPPTVPEGTARLRVTLSADHSAETVGRLATALRALPRTP